MNEAIWVLTVFALAVPVVAAVLLLVVLLVGVREMRRRSGGHGSRPLRGSNRQ